VNHYFPTPEAAVRAIWAGADMVLAAGVTGDYADTDGASAPAYDAVVAAVRSGRLPAARVKAAYERVLALKRTL
jgi:beta-N-acetylhexosaminidase